MIDSAMEWAVTRERELRAWSYLECKIRGLVPYFSVDSEYDGGLCEAYDLSDPKHEGYHDLMSGLWDNREGK